MSEIDLLYYFGLLIIFEIIVLGIIVIFEDEVKKMSKEIAILKSKYCSYCEAINFCKNGTCKNNKAKCYKYSKRLFHKRLRKIYEKEIKDE